MLSMFSGRPATSSKITLCAVPPKANSMVPPTRTFTVGGVNAVASMRTLLVAGARGSAAESLHETVASSTRQARRPRIDPPGSLNNPSDVGTGAIARPVKDTTQESPTAFNPAHDDTAH